MMDSVKARTGRVPYYEYVSCAIRKGVRMRYISFGQNELAQANTTNKTRMLCYWSAVPAMSRATNTPLALACESECVTPLPSPIRYRPS